MQLPVRGELAYAYTGGRTFDARLPAIVFVHGASHDHSVWNVPARYFAHHERGVLAVDLPGHGRSGGSPLASIGAIADWIVALLDAADLAQAALVGHSMGSLAALETAGRAPERVRQAVLIGTAVPMPVGKPLLQAAAADEPRAMAMINVWSHSPRGQLGGNAAPGMWMRGLNRRLMERAAPGVLHNDLSACNDYTGEAAARVRCPVLVISGARDMMTSARSARALAESIAGAKLVCLDGAGHNLTGERPNQLLDALRGFL
jgi:pimeloyl-ACP methyl ester carboxylesterase